MRNQTTRFNDSTCVRGASVRGASPKELSEAHKKAPKQADVPRALSVLLSEALSALPPVLLVQS